MNRALEGAVGALAEVARLAFWPDTDALTSIVCLADDLSVAQTPRYAS